MTVSPTTICNFLAACSGMAGAVLLYKGSFSLERPAEYMSEEQAIEMGERNKQRVCVQRAGMAFLFLSFMLQCMALFLPA